MLYRKYFQSVTFLNIKWKVFICGYVTSKPGHGTPCQGSEVLMRGELLSIFQVWRCLSDNSMTSVMFRLQLSVAIFSAVWLPSHFFLFNFFFFPSVTLFALVYATLHLPDFMSLLQCVVLNSIPLKCFKFPYSLFSHLSMSMIFCYPGC